MTSSRLLADLARAGVTIARVGDRLKLEPARKVTPTLRDAALTHKTELLAFLAEEWDAEVAERLLAEGIGIKDRVGFHPDAAIRRQQIRAMVDVDVASDRQDMAEYRQAVADVARQFEEPDPVDLIEQAEERLAIQQEPRLSPNGQGVESLDPPPGSCSGCSFCRYPGPGVPPRPEEHLARVWLRLFGARLPGVE